MMRLIDRKMSVSKAIMMIFVHYLSFKRHFEASTVVEKPKYLA